MRQLLILWWKEGVFQILKNQRLLEQPVTRIITEQSQDTKGKYHIDKRIIFGSPLISSLCLSLIYFIAIETIQSCRSNDELLCMLVMHVIMISGKHKTIQQGAELPLNSVQPPYSLGTAAYTKHVYLYHEKTISQDYFKLSLEKRGKKSCCQASSLSAVSYSFCCNCLTQPQAQASKVSDSFLSHISNLVGFALLPHRKTRQ